MSDLEKGFFYIFCGKHRVAVRTFSGHTRLFHLRFHSSHSPLPPSGAYRCCGERKKRRKHVSFSPSLISAKKDSTFSPFVQKSGREKKTGKRSEAVVSACCLPWGGGKREGWPFLGRRSAISGQEKKKFSLSLFSPARG